MPHQPEPQTMTLRAAMGRGLGLISRLVRLHPWAFVSAVAGAALFVSAIVASAFVIGNLADGLIVKVLDEGASTRGRLWPAVLAVIGVATWKAAGIVLRRSAAGWVQYRTQKDVRLRLIDHMLRLELSWFRRQSVGDLLAVTDSDASQATFILAPLPYATGALLLLVGTVATVAFLDPVMALVAALGIVVLSATDVHGSWKTFTAFARVQEARGRVARTAHESFDGALTVKALGREAHETARFGDISGQLRDHIAHINRVWNIYRVVVQGLLSVVTVVMLVVGAVRISAGVLTPGELITIAYLFTLLYIPIIIIGFVVWDMAHSVAAWDRVQTVLDAEDLVPYGAIGPRSDGSPASVAGDAVAFAYEESNHVIKTLDMAIPPGRTVAIVGATASGKSTLVTLLARLWDPTSGRIAIDERDLREFARSALPAEVAFVAQETFLFDDTVRGNIGFGATAEAADIEAAALLAGADDFIRELPHGYDTLLGERGATLSGGERQRIAIARALVRSPRLLILDDATSAVDPSVETRILQRLKKADLPSTVIIVAYRRSSITLADEVVYLENGRIVAHGSHEHLLREPGYALLLEAYDEDAAIRDVDGVR